MRQRLFSELCRYDYIYHPSLSHHSAVEEFMHGLHSISYGNMDMDYYLNIRNISPFNAKCNHRRIREFGYITNSIPAYDFFEYATR